MRARLIIFLSFLFGVIWILIAQKTPGTIIGQVQKHVKMRPQVQIDVQVQEQVQIHVQVQVQALVQVLV